MGMKKFKNTTKKEKLIMYFKENGYESVPSRTGKYIVLHNSNIKDAPYFFIGRNGAVRANSKNSATGSRTHTTTFTKTIKKWSEKFDPHAKVNV